MSDNKTDENPRNIIDAIIKTLNDLNDTQLFITIFDTVRDNPKKFEIISKASASGMRAALRMSENREEEYRSVLSLVVLGNNDLGIRARLLRATLQSRIYSGAAIETELTAEYDRLCLDEGVRKYLEDSLYGE